MHRLAKFAICLCVVLCLVGSQRVLHGQQQDPSAAVQSLVAKNRDVVQAIQARDYAAALKSIDEMIALGRQTNNRIVVATALYNKACVYSLTGKPEAAVAAARDAVAAGWTSYAKFADDSDFDGIRRHPAFVAFFAELREKYRFTPLQWDTARTVAAFHVDFDSSSHPKLVAMRQEFDTDQVVTEAGPDDYARLRAITAWTSRQWRHSTTNMASKADPVTILREARAGGQFICRDYAIVVAGLASAYGLPARVLNLLPRDVETRSEAHSVAEVWVKRFNKWVLADGQYGAIAEIDGVPLNAVELQAAIAREDGHLRCAVGAERCAEWKAFIVPNLFYFKFAGDQRRFDATLSAQLVLVPKGAPDPHKFAGGNEGTFSGAIYISDTAAFYSPPVR